MSKHRNIEKSRKRTRLHIHRRPQQMYWKSGAAGLGRRFSFAGGNPADVADMLGIKGVPSNAKALWGRSEDEAKATYISWKGEA